jgi:hypothetical protein
VVEHNLGVQRPPDEGAGSRRRPVRSREAVRSVGYCFCGEVLAGWRVCGPAGAASWDGRAGSREHEARVDGGLSWCLANSGGRGILGRWRVGQPLQRGRHRGSEGTWPGSCTHERCARG